MKKSNLFLFLLFVIIFIIGILFPSCESQSSKVYNQRLQIKPEICVIISNPIYDLDVKMYQYKIKRLEKNNVVTFIYDYNKFEKNDTILKKILN